MSLHSYAYPSRWIKVINRLINIFFFSHIWHQIIIFTAMEMDSLLILLLLWMKECEQLIEIFLGSQPQMEHKNIFSYLFLCVRMCEEKKIKCRIWSLPASFNQNTAWYIKLCKRVNSRLLAFLHARYAERERERANWRYRKSSEWKTFATFHYDVVIKPIQCNKPSFIRQTRHCTIATESEKKKHIQNVYLSLTTFFFLLSVQFHVTTYNTTYNIHKRAYSFIITFRIYSWATASVGSLSLVQIKYGINYNGPKLSEKNA